MTTRFMRIIALTAALSATVAPTAIGQTEAPDASAPAEAAPPAIVVVAARSGEIRDRVIASGLIRPVELVDVQPEVEGLAILEVNAEVGDLVRAGDVLAVLSDATLLLEKSRLLASRAKAEAGLAQIDAQIAEAVAQATEAANVRDRATRLASGGNASAAQVDQAVNSAAAAEARASAAREGRKVAEADLKVADAEIADIDLKLQRTAIRSPVDGTVAEKSARIGAIATGGSDPLFTVIRDGALELRADVSEGDVLKLEAGQPAAVTLSGLSRPVEGEVGLVEPTIGTATRLGVVRIALADAGRVRPGMYATAEITTSVVDDVLVPAASVTIDGEGASVLLVENGRARAVPVETGIRDAGMFQILSGLAAGDTVVAKAGAFVRDGDRVNPVLQDAEAPIPVASRPMAQR